MSAEAEICSYAERIVRLETERRDLASDIKDVKAEAKARGFNVKLIAACVRLMLLEQGKQDAALREHEELDIYLGAVGLIDGHDRSYDDGERDRFSADASVRRHDAGRSSVDNVGDGTVSRRFDVGGGPLAGGGRGCASEVSRGPGAPAGAVEGSSRAGGCGQGGEGVRDDHASAGEATAEGRASEDAGVTVGASASDYQVSADRPSILDGEGGDLAPDLSPKSPPPGAGRESPGTLSRDAEAIAARDARVAAYEAREAERLRSIPLDPKHPRYAIQFKIRNGRDPRPDEMEARP